MMRRYFRRQVLDVSFHFFDGSDSPCRPDDDTTEFYENRSPPLNNDHDHNHNHNILYKLILHLADLQDGNTTIANTTSGFLRELAWTRQKQHSFAGAVQRKERQCWSHLLHSFGRCRIRPGLYISDYQCHYCEENSFD